ncbi:hypothetical protein BIU82_08130 [Arthrobacter sp. SW1]|uniref:cache domain-containing protein n=1 Tax=Arthrobacter sp. SW1 TaxID=1920889 RepID=UPI000877B1F5|nr:cache domain-containing protein [Arthrobacter sp. SW1]OFI37075.1 hypothetical protein BIU82_08130 [Arthrobacter sp. SW1]
MNGNGAGVTTPAHGDTTGHSAEMREIEAIVAGIEGQVAEWAAATSAWLDGCGKPTGTAVDKFIRPSVQTLLQGPGAKVAGAGFIATLGLLGPDRSYIAWWQGDDMERVDALANFSPQSLSRYTRAEWFRIPVETGRPHVTGPYIDLLCTDEYVLTFTHPVFRGGQIAGIVGVDVTAQTLERLGLPPLRRIGPRAALVNVSAAGSADSAVANDGGRAVICATADIDAGDRVVPASGAESWPAGRQFRIYSSVEAALG